MAVHAETPLEHTGHPPRNRLLASMSQPDFQRLLPHLSVLTLARHQVLYRQDELPQSVLFPGGGACSLIKIMSDGSTAEIATIGCEGVIGLIDDGHGVPAVAEARVQVADRRRAVLMPAALFRDEMAAGGTLSQTISSYLMAFVKEMQQRAACNALHSAEQRTATWLLRTHDRVKLQRLPLTHEALAAALGLRRPTITDTLAGFQRRGMLTYRRGWLTLVDVAGLQQGACECYAIMRENYRRHGLG